MQRTTFNERKARVLSAHVTARRRQNRAPGRRAMAVVGAVIATLFCFFLLKGATLAWQGEAAFAARVVEDTSALRLWLSGIDPLTRLIADVLTSAPR